MIKAQIPFNKENKSKTLTHKSNEKMHNNRLCLQIEINIAKIVSANVSSRIRNITYPQNQRKYWKVSANLKNYKQMVL